MKLRKYIVFLLFPALFTGACKKSILQLPNPNAPTPAASLVTEGGIDAMPSPKAYTQGKFIAFTRPVTVTSIFFQLQWMIESNMGDENFSPYSNWGGRYPMNVASYHPAGTL